MTLDRSRIKKMLGEVFDEIQDTDLADRRAAMRKDFVFHMTDWLSDLERLVDLYSQSEPRDAAAEIAGFLYHVIPHLNAAGRLALERVPDPFAKDEY